MRKERFVSVVSTPVSLLEVSPADPSIEAIFQAYDGHDYNIDGETRRVTVCGVHETGPRKWVQLLTDSKMLTLVITEGATKLISKIS